MARSKSTSWSGWPSPDGALRLPIVSLLAIAAVLCFGIADALRLGEYGTGSIVLVLLGVVLVWAGSRPGRGRLRVSERNTTIAAGLAFTAWFIADLRFRGGLYGRGAPKRRASCWSSWLQVQLWSLLSFGSPPALAASVLLVGGACIAMVIASPAPRIDVWEMYQAVARGLLHGHNVYTQHWSPKLPHQATTYAYFPGAAVVLTPFYALFGDVRFGEILALLASAVLIGRMARDPQGAMFGALLLLFPYLTFSVEQSWSEPVNLVVLLLMGAW